ncbi:Vacuolar protein sorting-associated protein 41 [Saxophila tyrrhenica]|uniref:Vacuolar protein sorting-associated protein 41 n=1 Tax=Saxophila tyrrhenica TaxID=1690608 RepID=A0AAV9PHJ7_9PEZI|nr:Vacuolar protein sorting-associated protein 41 [Saxophila tyrrhenica]
MAADVHATEQAKFPSSQRAAARNEAGASKTAVAHGEDDEDDDDEEDEEEEEDEEPKLKYAKLTGSLTNVYRNGDSTSAFAVAGDKMVLGTHNGNVHVLTLPSMQPLRTYHAHSATITSISVSPTPPPPSHLQPEPAAIAGLNTPPASLRSQPTYSNSPRPSRTQQQSQTVSNTPNNAIYIATSSLDGHVCISSLLDPKDVQLRNFARPLQAVALSPAYTSDRTYLSGGLAGQLILTVGGKAGVTVDANTNSAAATAGGWLNSIGLGGDRGKDTVLHSGEGKICEIKWSLSGKWVVWVNEHGIKIMRSHLKLDSEASEDAWRRIAHAEKPNKPGWEEGAGVWRARAQWIDDRRLEADDEADSGTANGEKGATVLVNGAPNGKKKPAAKVEKLVVGWGNTVWILHVSEGGINPAGKKQVGSADIVNKFNFDCVISGLSLLSPSMMAILAYRTTKDEEQSTQQPSKAANGTSPKKGRSHRHTGLAPQLRLVGVDGIEVDLDELSMSRFETLSAQDYHLGTLYIPPPPPTKTSTSSSGGARGALDVVWDAAGGKYATRMFSSSASIMSRSSDDNRTSSFASPPASSVGVAAASMPKKKRIDAHPYIVEPGLKLFIQSPYDCVLAVKRGLSDRMEWFMDHKAYREAWDLADKHPEVFSSISPSTADNEGSTEPDTPRSNRGQGSLAEFFADSSSSQNGGSNVNHASAVEREKRHIGDLWLRQLVDSSQWSEAGRVAGKVLGTSGRWEHWMWAFAQANKFDEITPFIPSTIDAQLPSVVYEVVLGHYVQADPLRLMQLLEDWDPSLDLYDVGSVVKAIESRLDTTNAELDEEEKIKEGSADWKILTECLARLYLADARAKEALRCWIRVQNAEAAFRLIREEKMIDVVAAEDVTGLLMLRVSNDLMKNGSLKELQEASEDATALLVDEALRGTVHPATVISQLRPQGDRFRPFIYFYLRALWTSRSIDTDYKPRGKFARGINEGHALVEDHADLAVELFSQYDRELLMTFLRASSIYSYEKAAAICENLHYIPELVHILSKTGQTKRALFLIIGELGDVKQAIAFAKENPDLWDDLLDYSMNKPAFIKGLLEEVGTAIDPINLIRRIPEGLEIEGLKQGVQRMMREYDIQFSISEGVARVLRGEVAMGMDTLRAGQKKGVRFEVLREDAPSEDDVQLEVEDPPTKVDGGEELPTPKRKAEKKEAKAAEPGCCVGCGELFSEEEKEPLIGFACGHVYHLSCILKANPDTSDPDTISRLLDQLGSGADDEGAYTGRSVGGKVAHAHVIKNIVRGGCAHCSIPEGA